MISQSYFSVLGNYCSLVIAFLVFLNPVSHVYKLWVALQSLHSWFIIHSMEFLQQLSAVYKTYIVSVFFFLVSSNNFHACSITPFLSHPLPSQPSLLVFSVLSKAHILGSFSRSVSHCLVTKTTCGSQRCFCQLSYLI